MTALTLDYCPPPCGRRITDTDPDGCEAPTGQRYCLIHLPRDAYPELYEALHAFLEREQRRPRILTHWQWRHAQRFLLPGGVRCEVCGRPARDAYRVPSDAGDQRGEFLHRGCLVAPGDPAHPYAPTATTLRAARWP